MPHNDMISFDFFFRSNGLKKQLELLVSQHSELERVAATKVLQRHFDNNEK